MVRTEPDDVHNKRVLKQIHGNTEAQIWKKIPQVYIENIKLLYNSIQKVQNTEKVIPRVISMSN